MFHRQIVWLQLFFLYIFLRFHFEAPAKVRKKGNENEEMNSAIIGKMKKEIAAAAAAIFCDFFFLSSILDGSSSASSLLRL
jgi:hypothetical protein